MNEKNKYICVGNQVPSFKNDSASKKNFTLHINLEDLIKKTSVVCNQYNVNISAQTDLLYCVLTCGGVNMDTIFFSEEIVTLLRTNIKETIEKAKETVYLEVCMLCFT